MSCYLTTRWSGPWTIVGRTLDANRRLACSACGKRRRGRPLNSVVSRHKAPMSTQSTQQEIAEYVLSACVQHGREMLATQLPLTTGKGFDFMPSFQEMTINLYLAGVMWRYGEQFELPTSARDRGFICLISLLIADGMPPAKARKHVASLNSLSRSADGRDNGILSAGYTAQSGDGSLARIFETFRSNPEVAGAPYRLLDRTKPIAVVLGLATFGISAMTTLSWGAALGVGVITGAATLAIGLAIYRQMVKSVLTR